MSDAPFDVLWLLAERFGRSELCVQESIFTLPLSVWQRLIARAIQGPTLVEREGLLSVIDNALKHADAGYPDNPSDDPATFDTEFILACEKEGLTVTQALQQLVADKRSQRDNT